MISSQIWKRIFTRDSSLEKDEVADEQFRRENFTDTFGQYLQEKNHAGLSTFDALVTDFRNESQQDNPTIKIETFVIADGAFINRAKVPTWFQPHVRLLTAVSPLQSSPTKNWRIFIVGSDAVNDAAGFVQVASWDGIVFRFYAVEDINGDPQGRGWTYQGNSFNAFADGDTYDTAYLGPFNGHVNGACIMKELHSPWYHWFNQGSFLDCLSKDEQKLFESVPYLTGKGQTCFFGASVRSPVTLEILVEDAMSKWYETRLLADFCDTKDPKRTVPKPQPSNIQRWMSHLLLTTTVNIRTSENDGDSFRAPLEHFFDNEMLSQSNDLDLLPDMSQYNFVFDKKTYDRICTELRLSLLQEVRNPSEAPKDWPHFTMKPGTLGGGKQTDAYDLSVFLKVAANTEGLPFVVLQPSYEDAQGILSMQDLDQFGKDFPRSFLTTKTVRTLVMLDFWNPVYSWRRGVLMQYLPAVTNLVTDGRQATYDLEATFLSAIRASTFATAQDTNSPEYQFLQLYDGPDNVSKYQERVGSYLSAVDRRLQTEDGLRDYLKLAESRRRIYRPLPLDEFGVQLPYVVNLAVDWPYIEMTEAGTVQPIPQRGLEFLAAWTGTLHGVDPHILPTSGEAGVRKFPSPNAARCPVRSHVKDETRGDYRANIVIV